MTATTQDLQTPHKAGEIVSYPVAGSTTIYKGSLVALNSSGYLVSATDSSGYVFAGVAAEGKDNSSGSNGDVYAKVYVSGIHKFALSGAGVTSVGKVAYVSDNQTLKVVPGYMPVGRVMQYDSSGYVYVDLSYAGIADPWEISHITFEVGEMAANELLLGNSTTAYSPGKDAWISGVYGSIYGSTTYATFQLALYNGTTTLKSGIGVSGIGGKAWTGFSTSGLTPSTYISKGGKFYAKVTSTSNVSRGSVVIELKSPK